MTKNKFYKCNYIKTLGFHKFIFFRTVLFDKNTLQSIEIKSNDNKNIVFIYGYLLSTFDYDRRYDDFPIVNEFKSPNFKFDIRM
jgi:hypothetical protein